MKAQTWEMDAMVAVDETPVYKITTRNTWGLACAAGCFTGSADDVRDGFIHLSASHQVAATAAKYFANVSDLVLVEFRAADLGVELRWEPSRGGDVFPHYYAALPVDLARSVQTIPLGCDGMPAIPPNLPSKALV